VKALESYVYQYFINFFGWLVIEELFFALPLARRHRFPLRLVGLLAASYAVGYGLVQLARCIPNELSWMSIFYYILVYLLSMVVLWGCFAVEWKEIFFVATAGYAMQHITYAARDIAVSCYVAVTGQSVPGDLFYLIVTNWLLYVITGFLGYWLLARPSADTMELKAVDIRMILVSFAVLLSSVVLSEQVPPSGEGALLSAHIVCRLYAILACAFGLFTQFGISRMNRLETEQAVLAQLAQLERQQQRVSQESIDMINLKCHDLKYQIAALEHMENPAQRQATIQELKNSVDIYDSVVKSGNDTLDLVLTEKSLLCQKHQIKFSCMLDGKALSFLDSADLYSLFGNALDNAIECVLQAPPEKRIITLRIFPIQEMVMVHMDNYCPRPVQFAEDGMPITSKAERQLHGFGTRSIRRIAQRYGGEVRMSYEEQRFDLDILFHCAEAAAEG
jgi:hypothetical protein